MLSIEKFLTQKLTIFLILVSGSSLLLFLKILSEVIEKGRITLLDERIIAYVYSIRTPFLNSVMLAITSLGNTYQIAFVCIIAVVILHFHKRYKHIALLLVSLIVNTLFVNIIKGLVERSRPSIEFALIVENNFSFPSGHTIVAVSFYGVIIYFIYKAVRTKFHKYLALFLGSLIIISIGISRIYLGVHWPTDVIASYLLGVSWFSLLIIIIHYRSNFTSLTHDHS